jgi:hypothetical protein
VTEPRVPRQHHRVTDRLTGTCHRKPSGVSCTCTWARKAGSPAVRATKRAGHESPMNRSYRCSRREMNVRQPQAPDRSRPGPRQGCSLKREAAIRGSKPVRPHFGRSYGAPRGAHCDPGHPKVAKAIAPQEPPRRAKAIARSSAREDSRLVSPHRGRGPRYCFAFNGALRRAGHGQPLERRGFESLLPAPSA